MPLQLTAADPTHVPDAADYAGTYHSSTGQFSIVAEGDSLPLKYKGESVPLERRTRNSFFAHHPDFSLALMEFSRDAEDVAEVFHGGEWYVRGSYPGPRRSSYPEEWASYVGHYRARNPELSNFRIAARKGVLTLLNPWSNTDPLVYLSDGRFRNGDDERSPETLEFSAIAEGRALRANYTGCPYYRTFET